jgi:uncharacterized protein YraI
VVGQPTSIYQIHLKTVALHELGHSLGIDHSQDSTAIMWHEYDGPRGLNADDIAAVQALYGPPSPNEGGGGSPPAPGGVTARATTTVRVRSGPGIGFTQVGSVDTNAIVPVLGRNAAGDWLYIDAGAVRGWGAGWLFSISGDLNGVPVVDQNGNGANNPASPPPPKPTPAPPSNPGAVTGVTTNTVRVHSGPGTNYPTLGAVDSGITVNIIARNASGTWVVIEFQGNQGWAATWLFQISGDLNSLPVYQPRFYGQQTVQTLWQAAWFRSAAGS